MNTVSTNVPRAAIHVGEPAKSFSAAEGYEPERRGWDENTYRLKNQDTNNHYDFSRKHLNFEINGKGQIVPLGSNPVPLHERLKQRLDELGFKPYKDKNNPLGNPDNSPNCTVCIIVSGDHDVLTRMAFGAQDVDFTLKRSNANVCLCHDIKDWAMDTYQWACRRWGAENIIAFDVHNDETTPHIHIQTVPVAKTKTRGRASVKYVHKDDKTKVLSQKEWKKLSEDDRRDYVRTEMERREKECVSYARVWGVDKYAVGRTYYQMHTDYYNEVGRKYGLARGENIAMLPAEERRGHVHKNKAVLEAERQSKESVAKAKTENEQLHQQKSQLEGEVQQTRQKKAELDGKVMQLMDYADKLDIKNEALNVPRLKTSKIVTDAINAINGELGITIPAFKQKEWREQRKLAIKNILTNMQNEIFNAQELKEKEILELGRSIYKSAMKKTAELIKQNQQLHKENERVKAEKGKIKAENDNLKAKISTMDEKAINALRKQKNGEISELQGKLNEANRSISYYNNKADRESQRADKAESFLKEVFAVPEIKQIWDTLQQNIAAFWQQMDKWICDALATIKGYASTRGQYDYTPEQKEIVGRGILAEAFKRNLNPTDEEQRKTATNHLLARISWTGSGVTEGKVDFTNLRTQQVSDDMSVSEAVLKSLALGSCGRVSASNGGGNSYITQLTNWDGTKKKTGWGL